MSAERQLEVADRVRPLLAQARAVYAEILDGETALESARDAQLARAWRLGKLLNAMKLEVGHGRWLFWLGANWKELSERTAQRCMAFHKSNAKLSNPQNFADFDSDSVRTFMFSYVPAKHRPELDGDRRVAPAPHPLTFVNNFTKWDRQAELGLVTRPPVEVMRSELAPVIKRIADLLGRDYIEEVLG